MKITKTHIKKQFAKVGRIFPKPILGGAVLADSKKSKK